MEPIIIAEGVEIAAELILGVGGAITGSAVLSEALPFVSKVKANSTAQLVFNIFKMILSAFKKK